MGTLKITSTLENAASGINQKYVVASRTITTVGLHEQHGRRSIGTSEETIAVETDIGSLGVVKFINRDATNFIEIGIATGAYFSKLTPGGDAQFEAEPGITTFYVKADTAAADLEFHLFEA